VASTCKVTLITNETITHRFFVEQLRGFLGSLVEIDAYSLQEGLPARIEATIVVASTDEVLSKARSIIAHGTHVTIARRGVASTKIEEVLYLPKGSRVLVVSRELSAAEETAGILKLLGMDHVEYLPWTPGMPVPAASVAVTPGATHLIPPEIGKIVDIGLRPLDLSTLMEIVLTVGIPKDVLNSISFEHTRAMVRLNQRLSTALTDVSESRARLEVLMGSLDEGVAYVDRSGTVVVCNRSAQELLGLSEKTLKGKDLSAVLGREPIHGTLSSGIGNHGIAEVGSRKLSISTIPVKKQDEVSGAICVIRDISAVNQLEREIAKSLQSGHVARYTAEDILGDSAAAKKLVERIRKIAETDLTVLIAGESGVGKEVAAQAIHNLSSRRNGPFVAVNFAALPESLAESELFGYEEGAFTGARRGGRRGYFEEAHKGTIFLDEIGDSSPTAQASLLRVLQEKRIMRVGGSRVVPLDFRVIAATNRSLVEMVAQGKFRRDLYYRLNVLNLAIPPLRERREDIPRLLYHFLSRWGVRPNLDPEVLQVLVDHPWPGNVRELESVAANLALVLQSGRLSVEDLPETLLEVSGATALPAASTAASTAFPVPPVPGTVNPVIPTPGPTGLAGGKNGRDSALNGPLDPGVLASCARELEVHGDLGLYVEILECLDRYSGSTGIGRMAICKRTPSRMTPHVVRRYLRYLAQIGACVSGTTREGTRITPLGKALLGYIREARTSPI
jgi:PAS domain S-box-containing protein